MYQNPGVASFDTIHVYLFWVVLGILNSKNHTKNLIIFSDKYHQLQNNGLISYSEKNTKK